MADAKEIKEATRDWLRGVLVERELTPYALAKQAGVATTTIGRFLTHDVKYTLSASTIVKIMRATGIAAPPSILLGAPVDSPESVDQELLIRAVTEALGFAGINADKDLAQAAANAAAEIYDVLVEKGGDEAAINEALDTLRLSFRHRFRLMRKR